MPRYTELKKWFEQKSGRWLVLPVLIAATVALLATWSYPSAGELVVPKPLSVAVKAPQSPVAEQKQPVDDAVMNKLDERVKELESAQKALYLSWLDGQRKTVDWWLAFLAVMTAVLALSGALIPYFMGLKDKKLFEIESQKIQEEMAQEVEKVKRHGMNAAREIDTEKDAILDVLLKRRDGTHSHQPSPESIKTVQEASVKLNAKSKEAFTANEHYVRGAALYEKGDFKEALISFGDAIRSATNSPASDVVGYLFAKACTLGELSQLDSAVILFDVLDECHGKSESLYVRRLVVQGLVNKVILLGLNKRYEEVIKVCTDIYIRFGQIALPEQIAVTLSSLGLSQIMLAKKCWIEEGKRKGLLSNATQVLERALGLCASEDIAMIQGNLGYGLFLAGQRHAAEIATLQCLELGGKNALADQRGDAKLHRVEPEDTNYEQLLDELWHSLPTSKE